MNQELEGWPCPFLSSQNITNYHYLKMLSSVVEYSQAQSSEIAREHKLCAAPPLTPFSTYHIHRHIKS